METDAITRLVEQVAADVVTPRFRSLDAEQVEEKNPGDLVTVADHEAERLLTAALLEAYPDAVVLGEEASEGDPALFEQYAAADHAFVVDPVDGTKNFVHGSPDHAVMAAEVRSGAVVRAWIHQPQHRLTYVAERGAGAYRNGERLTVTPPTGGPSGWRGVTSRRRWVGHGFAGLAPLVLSWASCGVDYPRLVEGEADYLLYLRGKPWDHAPGGLILAEAGGTLRHADGSPYDPRHVATDGLLATVSPEVHDALAARWSETAGWR